MFGPPPPTSVYWGQPGPEAPRERPSGNTVELAGGSQLTIDPAALAAAVNTPELTAAMLARPDKPNEIPPHPLYRPRLGRAAWPTDFAPLARFIRLYFFRFGFLDGVAGFAHIAVGAFGAFLKYAKLRALNIAGREP